MKKTYIYLLFGLMVLAQLFMSAQIVYEYESVIASENSYKFKVRPIDPNDPFRGKYIRLNFKMNALETTDKTWEEYAVGYAYISKDENGFAVLESLEKERLPESDFDYLKVDIRGHYRGKVHFELPFDRFYMEESKALKAEELVRELQFNGQSEDVYAEVHMEGEIFVLTDVFVNGVSLKDAVME